MVPVAAVRDEASTEDDACIRYLRMLELPATADDAEVRSAITRDLRVWTRRTNAPSLDGRQEAERMVQALEKADEVLLGPSGRTFRAQARSKAGAGKLECPRCGLSGAQRGAFCPACGQELDTTPPAGQSNDSDLPDPFGRRVNPDSGSPRLQPVDRERSAPTRRSPARRPVHVPMDSDADELQGEPSVEETRSLFGLGRRVQGTVLAAEPPYQIEARPSPIAIVMRVLLFAAGLFIVPLVLIVGLSFRLAKTILMWQFGVRGGASSHGLGSQLASQLIGYFLMGKLFGQRRLIAVRDIRVRDRAGGEHLVRVEGDIVGGNLSVGDEVIVEGRDHHGTLVFRRGLNLRTNAQIAVRTP